MFGKVMSISDELMWKYYELLSSRSLPDIQEMKDKVNAGSLHPMEAKMTLAHEMVQRYHGKEEADQARDGFTRVFRSRDLPEDMPEVTVALERAWIGSVLKEAGLVASTSEAKRLIGQGAVSIGDEKVSDGERVIPAGTYIIKVGKRRFAKVTVK